MTALAFIAGAAFGWCARWVYEGGPGGIYDRMEWSPGEVADAANAGCKP